MKRNFGKNQNEKNIIGYSLFIICFHCRYINSVSWHGKSCAFVLTYDDGLNVYLNHVIPALDTIELKVVYQLEK